ncbi:CheR family methyltransferase (plasmid) [Rhizobium sp. T1470]|nr:CheR family methyltransferase [Rhizobium sp. T1473]
MSEDSRFPVVGVGASAGGVPALDAFFRQMPADPGVAIIVITHLRPDRESYLHEILARYTPMPVTVAANNTRVESNHVYVMPCNVTLTIDKGILRTRELDPMNRERKPIDIFLVSLALDQGDYSVAVILSGGDGDGTLGAKAVKEAGGLTLAQTSDGSELKNPEMPQSAIAGGFIDIAVPAPEMAARLTAYARSFDNLKDTVQTSREQEQAELENTRREICAILAAHSSHDFLGYKTMTFFRRVRRRMQVRQAESLREYIDLLKEEPKEVTALFHDLLINVTNFFRDEDAFRALEQGVIPRLFEGKGANDTIRIWVPGCATGEEVYSIAMVFKEHIERVSAVLKVQIFATDIDEAALAVARSARYPRALLDGVSQERRQRFFRIDSESYVISNDVRELCVFSPHSLIRDPPFSRMDLISCRNLLIYFGPVVQRHLIPTFHYALKPGGFLFLGSSESLGQHSDLFATLDKKQRLFQAREHPAKLPRLPSLSGHDRSPALQDGNKSTRETGHSLRQIVEARILDQYSPAHVVISVDADIFYYSGGTGKYLEVPQGVPSRQLLTLARKGLRLDLRSALKECSKRRGPWFGTTSPWKVMMTNCSLSTSPSSR